jgi:predicted alpha/beta-hydrolase family hydrolase
MLLIAKYTRCPIPSSSQSRDAMPRQISVEVLPNRSVTARLYPAAAHGRAGVTLILGPGAGAGQISAFIVEFATGLAARGIDGVTFNFLYGEQGRRIPDPNDRLEACYRAVIAAVRPQIMSSADRLVIGGKSMGGRIASQVAAAGIGDLAGLVFLGYPLHPPGRPDRLRAAHLPDIKAPMLFVQGSRDAFGTPDELRAIMTRLEPSPDLYVVEGGDHSFKVPKRAGVRQQDIHCAIQDHVAAWLRETAGLRTTR